MVAGRAVDDPEYVQYAVCRMMGWEQEVYLRQPSGFIRDLLAFSNIEQFAEAQHRRDYESKLNQTHPKH